MNKKPFSIRWHIFFCFIAFSALLLVFLYLVQDAFWDSIYSFYVRHSLKRQSTLIAENIDDDEIDSYISHITSEHSFSVVLTDQEGNVLDRFFSPRQIRVKSNQSLFIDFRKNLDQNKKSYLAKLPVAYSADGNLHYSSDDSEEAVAADFVYVRAVTRSSGESVMIFLFSPAEAPKPVRNFLRATYVWVSFILLILSFPVAFWLSKGIALPIQKITADAIRISSGDYSIRFEPNKFSEISQLTDTLNYTMDRLSKTEKLRRELLANVSHDLRTPLTMLRGYAEMIRDIPGENNPENVQIIIDEADRLSDLVNNVLDLSKLKSGTLEMHPITYCLTDQLFTLVNGFQKLSSEKNQVTFCPEEKVYITADDAFIFRAVYNLISNAIIHGEKDVCVTVRQIVVHGCVRISVEDNGPGIRPELLDGIWDRYRKGSGSGTGLGLAIAKASVEQNGGTVGVESVLGEGSTFWIELPLTKK